MLILMMFACLIQDRYINHDTTEFEDTADTADTATE